LDEHRIKAAFRGTAVRFSTHVYNDEADIERAATAIGPLVLQAGGAVRSTRVPVRQAVRS
jgi:hypothetical protein